MPGTDAPDDKSDALKLRDNPDAAKRAKEARELLAKMEQDKRVREDKRRGCCGCC